MEGTQVIDQGQGVTHGRETALGELQNHEVNGEDLSINERLVVSPCEGSLRDRRAAEGDYVCEGDVVAKVVGTDGQTVPVHSPFAGWVMGFLVPHGSPVRRREPLLWLRRH